MQLRDLIKRCTLFLLIFTLFNVLKAQSGIIDIAIKVIDPTACNQLNGEIHITPLNGVPPFQYSINGGATFQQDSLFTGLSIGTYIILVRDAQQQISPYTLAKLKAEGAPIINGIIMADPMKCGIGGTLKILTEGGNGTLQFSIDSGLIFQTSHIFSGIPAGAYNIIVKNEDGSCPVAYPTISFAPQSPEKYLTIQNTINHPECDSTDGIITVQVYGGSGGYLYSINDGENFQLNNTFEHLTAGNYTILVKDTLTSCEKYAADTVRLVNQNCMNCDELSIEISQTNPDCDSLNGKISVIATGGSGNYQYSFDEGVTFQKNGFFSNLAEGDYTILVEDIDFDCQKNANELIQLTPTNCPNCDSLTIQSFLTLPDCDSLNGRIELTINGGSGNYSISANQDEFQSNSVFNNLGAGSYIFTVKDNQNDCNKTFSSIELQEDCPECPEIAGVGAGEMYIVDCGGMATYCFTGADSLNVSTFTITDNGLPYGGSLKNCASISLGFELILDTGFHQIVFEKAGIDCEFIFDLEVFCVEDTFNIDTSIIIGQIDTLCFPEYLMTSDILSIVPTCEGQNPSVGFEINNLTNCLIYEGLMLGMDTLCVLVCEEVYTCAEVIITVLVTDSMTTDTLCQPIFTSPTETIELSDCAANSDYCLNQLKSDLANYSLTINGELFTNEYADCDVPEQASLSLPLGIYELILTENEGECADTAKINIICEPLMNQFEDTILVNETDTFCLEGLELAGDIVSIENICENISGEMVVFEVDTINKCLYYTGIEIGKDTACIEVCDELGTCDTTIVIITVEELDTILPPIAVDDRDTLEEDNNITIHVLGNDTTNSTLITVTIIDNPIIGMATVNPDMTISYTPNNGICDTTDSFTYELCNPSGCDTARVSLYIECKLFQIYNGISPNFDGVNDTFTIDGIEKFPNNELKIYNRWGNMVYQQKGYKGQWNGTWEEKLLPDGTYFYILDNGEGKKYSGFLEIRR